jgi:hypothetical protein
MMSCAVLIKQPLMMQPHSIFSQIYRTNHTRLIEPNSKIIT